MAQDKEEKRAKLSRFPTLNLVLQRKKIINVLEEKENEGLYLALMSSCHTFKANPKRFCPEIIIHIYRQNENLRRQILGLSISNLGLGFFTKW